MEPVRETDRFSRRITASDANNIVAVLDLFTINGEYQIYQEDYKISFQVALEDVKCTVGLFSLSSAPFPETNALMSEAARNAEVAKVRTEGQKIALSLWTAKGNGPWKCESQVVLQNQEGEENHVPLLVPYLGSNETTLVGGDFKFGVKVEPIWNQPLKANDYLVISGTYKQIVSFTSKKKDDIEQLNARIEALELALSGRLTDLPANTLLGRDATTGIVQQVPQSRFATPAQIASAIAELVGSSNTALNTLAELGAALANDANFAATVTTNLAAKLTANANLTDLISRQTALNNLAGAVTANRILGGDGTNIILRQVALAADVTGVLPVANGGTGINAIHSFRAGASVVQTVPVGVNGIFTKIVLNSEVVDTNNQYNPTLSRLTALVAETWQITAYITFNPTVTTRIILSIFKNGAEVSAVSRLYDVRANAGFFSMRIPVLEFALAANDYLEVYAYMGSATDTSADASLAATFWSGRRIA